MQPVPGTPSSGQRLLPQPVPAAHFTVQVPDAPTAGLCSRLLNWCSLLGTNGRPVVPPDAVACYYIAR